MVAILALPAAALAGVLRGEAAHAALEPPARVTAADADDATFPAYANPVAGGPAVSGASAHATHQVESGALGSMRQLSGGPAW